MELFWYFLGLLAFVALVVFLATRGSSSIDAQDATMRSKAKQTLVKD